MGINVKLRICIGWIGTIDGHEACVGGVPGERGRGCWKERCVYY
jgi:hypothetical protein